MIRHTFIDTHTHLDDAQFADDVDTVIACAVAVGVSRFINIGYSPERWQSTLALAAHNTAVSYTLGLHPGHAGEWSDPLFVDLVDLVRRHNPVAIGEIGLDYYWTTDNKKIQWVSFERQLELAHHHALPVIIHQRAAAADVAAILKAVPDDLAVVLHSCDGDPALMDLAADRGWMIGVGGLMTRRSSESLRLRLPDFPIAQILLETDSPYLVPSGVKSRRNEPSRIPLIAERLANLVGRSVSEIAEATTLNAERMFGLVPAATAA